MFYNKHRNQSDVTADQIFQPLLPPRPRLGTQPFPLHPRREGARQSAPGSSRCSSRMAISRMRNFCTLPVTVMGNSSTSFQYLGILNVAMLPRQ